MFQREQDAASKAQDITYRFRPARGDYTTDKRLDWCIARLHSLPNQFPADVYNEIGRMVTDAGLGMCSVGEPA